MLLMMLMMLMMMIMMVVAVVLNIEIHATWQVQSCPMLSPNPRAASGAPVQGPPAVSALREGQKLWSFMDR